MSCCAWPTKVLNSPKSEVVFTTKLNMLPIILQFLTFVISKVIVIMTGSEGNRGSNEIITCLLKCIALLKDWGVGDFTFYSDNCGGQNRNRYFYSMWEYAASAYKVNIIHRFLEKEHTQNGGNRMYATIECAKKGKIIYVPSQWITLVRCTELNKNV